MSKEQCFIHPQEEVEQNLLKFSHSYMHVIWTIGNVRWSAPELFCIPAHGTLRPTVSARTDVYSFGCVLLEVIEYFTNYTSLLFIMHAIRF